VAHNIIPDYAKVIWNIRCLPNANFQDLLRDLFEKKVPLLESKMKQKYCDAFISNRNISNILPLNQKKYPEILNTLTKKDPKHKWGVSYGTDAGYFSKIGWPTIVCGPGKIEQAHTSDEFIKIKDIKDGINFMMNLMSGILA
jgi:acetylornithine deacetylase